jgi:SAM-dependent methyltransferase
MDKPLATTPPSERQDGRGVDRSRSAPRELGERDVSPNSVQIAYWGESAGRRWSTAQESLDAVLAPLGLLAVERGAPRRGERVLDVGCGCADTTLELSNRVGSAGYVLGVDISEPMLARASERLVASGRSNVELGRVDAQTHTFPPDFDLVYSRFGVMFFDDSRAAFANLRRATSPGGRLAFVCWQSLDRNPWMSLPLGVVERHLGPAIHPGPDEPGPFAFAATADIEAILRDAGFVDIAFESVQRRLRLGADLESALEFVADSVGLTAAMLREAPLEVRAPCVDDLREMLGNHVETSGVHLDAAVWVVSAERMGP